MMTYDRNRNAITTGSRVMISGTGQFGVIKAKVSSNRLS